MSRPEGMHMITQNDPRRWKERADGSMVSEDRSATANLSPNVKIERIPHHAVPVDPSTGHAEMFMDPLSLAFFGAVRRGK